MKTRVIPILTAMALLVLAGCRRAPSEEALHTLELTPSPAAAQTEEPTPAPTPEPTPAPPPDAELPGRIEFKTYENAYFGLGCRLDRGWEFSSPAQIAALAGRPDASAEESGPLSREELFFAMLEENGAGYAMAASDGTVSVNMTVQDLGDGADARSVIAAALEEMPEALLETGINSLSLASDQTQFAGRTVPRLTVSGSRDGTPVCQRIVAVEAFGRLAVITAAADSTEAADVLLAAWYEVEIAAG